jgi:hypothetical protein
MLLLHTICGHPLRCVIASKAPRYHILKLLKKHLAGQKFHEDKVEEVKNKVTTWLRMQVVEFFDTGIQKPIPRLNKCCDNSGH